jgi:hypothetical protein
MTGFSGRHVLPFLVFSIYWIGEGFLAIHEWLVGRVSGRWHNRRLGISQKPAFILSVLVLTVLVVVLPKTLKPLRYERLTEKQAGAWIKDQSGGEKTVFGTVPHVAYYAGGEAEHLFSKQDALDKIGGALTNEKALFIAMEEEEIPSLYENSELLRKNFIEAKRFRGKGMKTIVVYQRTR